MSPMLIVRVEHGNTHKGPWSNDDGGHNIDAAGMPAPRHDLDLWYTINKREASPYDYHFGFVPGQCGLDWFTDRDRVKLDRKGYVVRHYLASVVDVLMGYSQVMFKIEEALPVQTNCLVSKWRTVWTNRVEVR